MKIISLYKFSEENENQIKSYGTYEYCEALSSNQLVDCEVLIGNPKVEVLKDAKHLKWIQLCSAGNDQYQKEDLPQNTIMCNASGTFGRTISEHLLLYTIALFRNMKHYVHNQDHHVWDKIHDTKLIYGSTFVILGVGDIGIHYAKAIQALGGYTIGIRKRNTQMEEGFHEMHTIDSLDKLLPKADVVVLALPKHPSTDVVISKQQLQLMKEDCCLLNVGRGNAIDHNALIEVLEQGHLGGVHLDVYEKEPLEKASKLWDFKNVVLTPHVSGTFANKQTHILFEELVLDNFKRYANNETLRNIVDFTIGYRKLR